MVLFPKPWVVVRLLLVVGISQNTSHLSDRPVTLVFFRDTESVDLWRRSIDALMSKYSVNGLKYRGFPYVLYILITVQTVSQSKLYLENGKKKILFFLERIDDVSAVVNNQRWQHNIMNKANQYHQRPISEAFSIIETHLLGKGSTGNVYLGFQRNHLRRQVAIKSIDLKTIDNEVTRYLLSCEIAALSNLGKLQNTGHENIVKLHDIVLQDHHIYLVMEYLQGGTLSDYLRKHPNGLPDDEVMRIFRQILQGYLHMERKGIVHRDLKPDNILFKKDPQACKTVAIIDFGYCQMKEVPNKPQVFYNVGSPKYMAPQAYKQNNYSQKSDIWALGVILYEMVFGRTCDRGLSMGQYLHIIERQGIPFPVQVNPFHRHILNLMLKFSHHDRSKAEEILREIDMLSSNLNHQRSQIILSRKSIDDGLIRNSLDPFQIRPNKQTQIFHSLIIPKNNSSFHHPSLTEINGLNQQRVVLQRRSERVNQAIPAPQGFARNGQILNQMIPKPQPLCLVQNVNIQSVRDIIQRRHIEQSNFGSQLIQKQVNGNSLASTTNSNQYAQLSQESNQHHLRPIQGNNFSENIQNKMISEPRHINFAHPKVRFITNFQTPTNQTSNSPVSQAPMQFNQPNNNFVNNFPIVDKNNIIIEQETKIQVLPAKIYQKVQIFSTTSPKYWQKNEKLLKTEESNPLSQPRPIINLRPSTNQGEIRVGFIRLQPQRLSKPPIQPTLLRQGFCA